MQRKLYVVNHGRLTPVPEGVMMIIPTRFMPFVTSPLISWPGKLRMGLDLFIPGRKDDEDESLGHFIRRRLGQEALDKIAEPLMAGIHVSDPEEQSLLGTFPRYRAMEKQYGSLIRGMLAQKRAARARRQPAAHPDGPAWKRSAFVSFRGGMGQLVAALEKALSGVALRTGSSVTGLQPLTDGGYRVMAGSGPAQAFDAVVLAAPAFAAAGLVASFAPDLATGLRDIHYVSTATVSLGYRSADWGEAFSGIGFLVPQRESRQVSACTMSSLKFEHRAPEGSLLLRCFVGGPGREEALERSDAEIIASARAELADLMGVRAEPVMARVFRWAQGNAQYDVGHLDRVRQIKAGCPPGLYLAGSAYEGVGVPDCIHQGQQAASAAWDHLAILKERQVSA